MTQRIRSSLCGSALVRDWSPGGRRKDLAAKELGLARSALFKRLKEWGLNQGGLRALPALLPGGPPTVAFG
jgi:hypothetical protein